MKARAALREATADEHKRVDRLFSHFDLGNADEYRLFLTAQAGAHLPVERALNSSGVASIVPDWPLRRRSSLLEADLAELGAGAPPLQEPPSLPDPASMLGALYVIEGSRLGGAVLKRSVPEDAPRRFLDAHQGPGAWRKLLVKLDEILYEPARVEAAIATAREVFLRFEAAGQAVWRSRIVE